MKLVPGWIGLFFSAIHWPLSSQVLITTEFVWNTLQSLKSFQTLPVHKTKLRTVMKYSRVDKLKQILQDFVDSMPYCIAVLIQGKGEVNWPISKVLRAVSKCWRKNFYCCLFLFFHLPNYFLKFFSPLSGFSQKRTNSRNKPFFFLIMSSSFRISLL